MPHLHSIFAGYYAAKKKGYYKQAGLDVRDDAAHLEGLRDQHDREVRGQKRGKKVGNWLVGNE